MSAVRQTGILGWLAFLSVCCTSGVLARTYVSGSCKGNQCYLLYKEAGTGLTWNQTYTACTNMDRKLVTIPDEQTQEAMKKLPQRGGNAWVSIKGHLSNWLNPDGSESTADVSQSDTTTDKCAILSLSPNNRHENKLEPVSCTSVQERRAVCQYPLTGAAVCRGGYNISNVCYRPSADGFSTTAAAGEYCGGLMNVTMAESAPELAYTGVSSTLLMDVLWYNNMKNDSQHPEVNQFWIGIRRKFVPSLVNGSGEVQTNYTRWGVNQPASAAQTFCVSLDLSSDSTWIASPCDQTLPYYVCTGSPDDVSTTTEAPTTTPQTTVIETTTTANRSVIFEKSKAGLTDFSLVLVIVFSVGGFLFLVGVIVAIYISCHGKKYDDESYVSRSRTEGDFDSFHESYKSDRLAPNRNLVMKSRAKSHHEQVQDIFISPQISDAGAPDRETGEFRGRASGALSLSSDSFVARNPVYSVNRSEFSEPALTYQNIDTYGGQAQSATLPTSPPSEATPPLPPKSATLQQRLSMGPPLVQAPPPPRSATPSYEHSDNMLF